MQTLSDLFTLESIVLDTRICTSLFTAVDSVMHGFELLLTAMGRGIGQLNYASEKHAIKRIDRLLGNKKLHSNRNAYYKQMVSYFVGANHQRLIHIDWSTVYNYKLVVFRTAISIQGRAITLYEEVPPEKVLGHRAIHNTRPPQVKTQPTKKRT